MGRTVTEAKPNNSRSRAGSPTKEASRTNEYIGFNDLPEQRAEVKYYHKSWRDRSY